MRFIEAPTGRDGIARINVDDVAAFVGHTVVSYTYETWTLVTLKSGVQIDVHITPDEFRDRMHKAATS